MAQAYTNSGGQGFRRYLVLVKAAGITFGGALRFIVEQDTSGTTWWNGQANSGTSLTFDFGSPRIVDEAKWSQDNSTSHGTWKWQGSNDDSSYTDIGSSFTLGGSTLQTQTTLNGNTTPYRFYRMAGVSGSASSSPFLRGIQFQINAISASVPDYGNPEGAGDRTAIITVTQSLTSGSGNLIYGRSGVASPIMSLFVDNLNRVDGSGTGALEFESAHLAVSGKWIQFLFSQAYVIDQIRWFQDTLDSYAVWQLQGSNDGSSFTNIGSSGAIGGGFDSAYGYSFFDGPNGNTTAYQYYRIAGVSGSASLNPFLFEVAFRIATGTAPPGGALGSGLIGVNPIRGFVA
jgi:hypothetical protein